ncbi:neuromedin-U receptor 2-like [Diadema setosum]|uniref:neuromedin-U receptor 2-like n=1 Tax=Diadema setosum TaxID=31175 RepID=UPI003B3AE6FF
MNWTSPSPSTSALIEDALSSDEIANSTLGAMDDQPQFEQRITLEVLQLYIYSYVDKLLVTVAMPIIFIIGVIGNTSVIVVFFRIKTMRTVTNHYLINLAIADLLFFLSAVPQFWILYASSPVFADYKNISLPYCKFSMFGTDVGIIVSGLTVILVTLERYVAICWPHKFKQLSTRPRAILVCGLIWLFTSLYKIPTLVFSNLYTITLIWPETNITKYEEYPRTKVECSYCLPRAHKPCDRFRFSLTVDQFLLLMVIPVTMVLYTLIVLQLQRLTKTSSLRGSAGSSSTRMKKQVVRMLIVTITVYIICITPFRLLNLFDIYQYMLPANITWVLVNTARIMMYTNSAVNPIIYNIMSDRYRHAFRDTFLCCIPGYMNVNGEASSDRKSKYTNNASTRFEYERSTR